METSRLYRDQKLLLLSISSMALLLAACSAFFTVQRFSMNPVRGVNASGNNIANIEIFYTGGSKIIPLLRNGESFRYSLILKEGANLEVAYTDATGGPHREALDGTMTPGKPSPIDFEFGSDGHLHLKKPPEP